MFAMSWAVILCFACTILTSVEGFFQFLYKPDTVAKNYSIDTTAIWYSNDVYEDGKLKVPPLVRKYGYSAEAYTVTTADGYILELHRIPQRRNEKPVKTTKPVIFLMHDTFCSSAVWVLMGPANGLAYILADNGFDVWMGNARGTTYSRGHTEAKYFTPASYWNFSWDEIGDKDLPTMIDYVLNHTGAPNLYYVGHGQGATVFFVMTTLHPEYNKKIISMHALAPMAYMKNIRNVLLKQIVPYAKRKRDFVSNLGMQRFIPNNSILSVASKNLCRAVSNVFKPICSSLLFLWGGWSDTAMNKTMLPTIFGHLPTSASVGQIVHYAQLVRTKKFHRFDRDVTWNKIYYGKEFPPEYGLQNVSAPVYLYYSKKDTLADEANVKTLSKDLNNLREMFVVNDFNHYDFLFGLNAKRFVYDVLLSVMEVDYITRKQNEMPESWEYEYDKQW